MKIASSLLGMITTYVLIEPLLELGPLGIVPRFIDLGAKLTTVFPRYGFNEAFAPTRLFETYDFVIIGAGPTGSVLANRLSEISQSKILLLEAGGEPNVLAEIPLLCPAVPFTEYDWGYYTEPQEGFCTGCNNNRSLRWPHGKVLGGTTVSNFMIYVRGNKHDYDRWQAMGNPGWSYDDVLPYFRKSEDNRLTFYEPEYHGNGGELGVSNSYHTRIGEAIVAAARQAGHPYVDYNGEKQIGSSIVQTTITDGRRCSAEKAFLRPVRRRSNLKIRIRALATKILVDPNTKTAFGVTYVKDGIMYTVYAKKEVILSAGALNSPQLLMLSGIGPKQHLEELGIPVVKDLAVGEKMYDHSTFPGLIFEADRMATLEVLPALLNPQSYKEYIFRGRGPLTSIGSVEALIYINTNTTIPEYPSWPDVELICVSAGLNTDLGTFFRPLFNVPKETYDAVWKPLELKPIFQVLPMLMQPQSVGFLKLRSSSPFDPPMFYPNYFSDPENKDIKAHITAIRVTQNIIRQIPMKNYGVKQVETPIPGCEMYVFDSDEYWECVIRSLTGSFWHQIATCKMGPETDKEAVVDAKLKVHGIKRLRVADTSIIPAPISAHTSAPAYMIGEKVSDMIKQDWNENYDYDE